MRVLIWILIVLAVLIVVFWIGKSILPPPLPPPPVQAGPVEMMPLPEGLPAPVERFYRTVYGDEIPVITSAVMSGRGWARPFGPFYWPMRFRFVHDAGRSYRHYIELTWFGLPLMKVNEQYIEGRSKFLIPIVGNEENEPKTNQGGALGLWAETSNFPAVYLTTPGVRWEAVDEETALLYVPVQGDVADHEEVFVTRFDPETGLMLMQESMRYQTKDSPAKVLWITQGYDWQELGGYLMGRTGAATWLNEGTPWARFTTEEVIYNAELGDYLTAIGP